MAGSVASTAPIRWRRSRRRAAGGQHHLYRDGVGGAECLGDADERPVLVEFHHRRGGPVPVQHLAGRDADGARPSRTTRTRRPGRAVPGVSSGYITGVRFYKEPDDTGTHIGSSVVLDAGRCWRPGRSAVRPRRGGRSWTSPPRWRSPRGRRTWRRISPAPGIRRTPRQGLASAVTNGPLTALAGGGVYAYGSSNTFPTSTYNNNNYWVDVVYSTRRAATAPGGADRGVGDGGQRVGDGELDGAEQRRQRDHQLHGDAVHRVDGADAGDGVRGPRPRRRR